MVQTLVIQLVAAIGGLWLADAFIPNVSFTGDIQTLLIAGGMLGIANAVLRPILNLITLPIRVLTLGLSSLLINMALVWAVDILFPELVIEGIVALFWTTVAVWGLGMVLSLLGKGAF